ncbi:SDR family oxidoreductase [Nocardia africana]|uniref:Gluconate 5-dehydrogenase n=1 Tax=Nocardia africana TaxID=134964 RepID=A0A378WYI6_9NOCA|nr:SDR family oxidoreductase [Nocardia africana]MCC3312282.1 SDR family oxidoreductase [Nocardia africana]SUA46410.1 Gluconate 5-dehydrogenase [Nocardia africana]
MPHSLAGRIVAVTGGSRGIGFAISRAFRECGAHVAIGALDEAQLRSAADDLNLTCYSSLDVSDPGSFRTFLDKVTAALGPIDVLVNNAGIMPVGPLLAEDDELTRRTLDTDVLGMIVGTKRALELMIPRGRGHVVNICSVMGQTALPGMATYNACKAAAITFTDAARLEYRHTGVRISTILPGGVGTELIAGLDATVALPIPGTSRRIPLIRTVEPADVAHAVIRTVAADASRPRVYVPRIAGAFLGAQRLLPRAIGESLNLRLGGENARHADTDARRNYQNRISTTTSDG